MALDLAATLTAEQRQRILAIAAAEQAESGRPPLGEGARAALAGSAGGILRQWLWHDPDLQAYACVTADGAQEVHEFTSQPDRPATAHALLAALRAAAPSGALWAHGDRAQARIAAGLAGLPVTRELLLMSRSLRPPPVLRPVPPLVTIRPFDPDSDGPDWLRLNAVAFADLPDQAGIGPEELNRKVTADWFDAAGFLVAEAGGELVGFHWTKIDPAVRVGGQRSGEVYVIGVAPDQRGTGLAPALLDAGLDHLARAGMTTAHLYVEADNVAAVALYRRSGFEVIDTDRLYVW